MYSFYFRSPGIESLPVELLTRIFILGAGFDYPYTDSPFLLKPDQDYYAIPSFDFQLLVSHVCQHWRQVALSISSLWSILYFRSPEHLPRALEFLSRCKRHTQLLDITIDTVAGPEYLPGVNLFGPELLQTFELIVPQVRRWRSFHLKVRGPECKAIARKYLSTCGPAPNLETLQLYHFEDYRTSHNLYLATYRPPVAVFDNNLPRLRNVSLIGVNLRWADSPYLAGLHDLELALHPDNIRPPYEHWDSMLRNSPNLKTLSLHYSGPRLANGETKLDWPLGKERLYIESLENLSLTDLDPDYLCLLLGRLFLPRLKKLSLDLPDQDFTSFVELIGGSTLPIVDEMPATSSASSASSPSNSDILSPPTLVAALSPSSTILATTSFSSSPFPLPSKIETLVLTALECNLGSLQAMLRALEGLRYLEVHFARLPSGFFGFLVQGAEGSIAPSEVDISSHLPDSAVPEMSAALSPSKQQKPLFPQLQVLKISGLPGERVKELIEYRENLRRPQALDAKTGVNHTNYGLRRWIIAWSWKGRGKDAVLDQLVDVGWQTRDGRCVHIETFDDESEENVEDEDDDNTDEDGNDD